MKFKEGFFFLPHLFRYLTMVIDTTAVNHPTGKYSFPPNDPKNGNGSMSGGSGGKPSRDGTPLAIHQQADLGIATPIQLWVETGEESVLKQRRIMRIVMGQSGLYGKWFKLIAYLVMHACLM